MSVYLVTKKLGQTPLEKIEEVRESKKIPESVSMTYAGRLDPAAEGKLIILTDKDVLEKEKYTSLSKIYVIDVLFGLKTDTGDLLGIPTEKEALKITKNKLMKVLKKLSGKRLQKYHPYSSKNIGGVPLWKMARENIKIKAPEHIIEIKNIKILKENKINYKNILSRVEKICAKVRGDFRQEKIIESWKKIPNKNFQSFQLEIKSSAGAYMRVLAEEIGEELGENCTCFSIKRTKIESFT